jgi:hypothetical protein
MIRYEPWCAISRFGTAFRAGGCATATAYLYSMDGRLWGVTTWKLLQRWVRLIAESPRTWRAGTTLWEAPLLGVSLTRPIGVSQAVWPVTRLMTFGWSVYARRLPA